MKKHHMADRGITWMVTDSKHTNWSNLTLE